MNLRACLGFSFVEILIGIVLSSALFMALGRYTILVKKQFIDINQIFNESADVRRATSMLRASIWQAGFTPCSNIDLLTSIDRRESPESLHSINLEHGVKINRMHSDFSEIMSFDDKFSFTLWTRAGITPDHAVIIADCKHAEVQSVTSVNQKTKGVQVRLKRELAFSYTPPVYVGEWVQEYFFVKKVQEQPGALFYNWHNVVRLTDHIHALSAQLKHETLGQVLHIELELDKKRTMRMLAMVRAR